MARPAPDDIDGDWLPGTVCYPVELVPPRASIPRASRRGRGSMAASRGWRGGCSTCPVRRAAGV